MDVINHSFFNLGAVKLDRKIMKRLSNCITLFYVEVIF